MQALSSKVLLAFLPEAEIEQITNSIELLPFTPHTITDPAQLRAELAAIRQRGYATSFEETDLGAMGDRSACLRPRRSTR